MHYPIQLSDFRSHRTQKEGVGLSRIVQLLFENRRATQNSRVIDHRVFIVGSVWVEPHSSAAGSRMLQLIQFFLAQKWKVFFGTAAIKGRHSLDLRSYGVHELTIESNNSTFDLLIQKIKPTIVLFDRFVMEEQFGWRVAENCPDALRILDSEDLHCLRKTRHEAIKKQIAFTEERLMASEITKREIASIYRCDLSLIISRFEMKLLKETFKIQESLLCHLPFFLTPVSEKRQVNWPSYEDRKHFVFIGNFLHAPNLDAALMLKRELWRRIRPQIPDTQLHIYGAYPNQQIRELHNVKEHFYVHGFTESATDMLEHARVLLAPLRFGAGIKGKLTDAMQCGTPSVTTNIGAEGMCDGISWSGFIADDWEEFARSAVLLYSQKKVWLQAQQNGTDIINNLFVAEKGHTKLLLRIEESIGNLSKLRSLNFIGQLLHYHTAKSTKYLSKWIEEKKGGSPKN